MTSMISGRTTPKRSNRDTDSPPNSSAVPFRNRHLIRRQAFTLIELLLVLTLTVAVLSSTVVLISIARTSNQKASDNLLSRQQIRRFADDLRRDVRSADGIEVIDDGLTVTHSEPNRQIVYSIDSGAVILRRVEQADDPIPLTDRYAVGESVAIDVQQIDRWNAVQWTFAQPDRENQPIQILASTGLTQ